MFSSFNFQMYLLSSVLFFFCSFMKLALCDVYLVLKVFAVSPMYCFWSLAVDTVALYTAFWTVHFPGSGHSVFLLQLHVSCCCSWCGLDSNTIN